MKKPGKGITMVGLGPGNPNLFTREAWEILSSIPEIYLLSASHPVVAGFPPELKVIGFDKKINDDHDLEQVVLNLLDLGRRGEGVIYGVPGHPFIDDLVCPEVFQRAKAEGIPVKIIEGISLMGSALASLEKPSSIYLSIIPAQKLTQKYYPLFPPNFPTLVTHIQSASTLTEIKLVLTILYPANHPVCLIFYSNVGEITVENIDLDKMDEFQDNGQPTSLFIPPLGERTSFEEFQELIAHLRSPEGCPWDREQNHQSLQRNLMEETYEALQAIDLADPGLMQEEFGDLLLQIVLQSQIASENGDFTMSDVIQGIYTKLVQRHPHVFGNEDLGDAQGVIKNWERIKALERGENEQEGRGLLSGIPTAMPALSVADAYQRRAARVGFDWPEIADVIEKIKEEIIEFQQSEGEDEMTEEIGDMFFALANLARWVEVDPEGALRKTNKKFRERFAIIEAEARHKGIQLSDMTLEEMDEIWDKAKENN